METLGQAAARQLRRAGHVTFYRGGANGAAQSLAARDAQLCERPEDERSAYWQIQLGAAVWTADDPWSAP